MNAKQFAKLLGVHPQTVSRWINAGMPVKERLGWRTLRIDPDTARSWLRKRAAIQRIDRGVSNEE